MNNMKDRLKRLSVTALAFAAAAAVLTGCGSKKVSEGYWVLSEISDSEEKAKGDALEDYGLEEAYIVTEDNGEGYAVLFGIPADFEINEDKGNFEFETGKVNYKISGKKLTLADSNVTMVFEKSKEDAPQKPEEVALSGNTQTESGKDDFTVDGDDDEAEDTDEAEEESEDTDTNAGLYNLSYSNPREYFEGDWYGWMTVTGVSFSKRTFGRILQAMHTGTSFCPPLPRS